MKLLCLRSSFIFLAWHPCIFLAFMAIAKSNYYCLTSLGITLVNRRCCIRLVCQVEKQKLWAMKLLDVGMAFFFLSYLQCTNNVSSLIPWITFVHYVLSAMSCTGKINRHQETNLHTTPWSRFLTHKWRGSVFDFKQIQSSNKGILTRVTKVGEPKKQHLAMNSSFPPL
jgi:hypothetical protein